MEKIFVVELLYRNGSIYQWAPATSGRGVIAFDNFNSAHKARRDEYRHLKAVAPRVWTWKRIRVRRWNAPAE